MQRSEQDIRANKVLTLFRVDGADYKTAALPANESYEWLEQAAAVSKMESDMGTIADPQKRIKALKEYTLALLECVLTYNTEAFPREKLENKLSCEQIIEAFVDLQALTDPTVLGQAKMMKTLESRFKNMPEGTLQRVLTGIL